MFINFLLKAAVVAVDAICEPLPDDEYEEYQPSTKSLSVDENGNTITLVNSSEGWKINDLS